MYCEEHDLDWSRTGFMYRGHSASPQYEVVYGNGGAIARAGAVITIYLS